MTVYLKNRFIPNVKVNYRVLLPFFWMVDVMLRLLRKRFTTKAVMQRAGEMKIISSPSMVALLKEARKTPCVKVFMDSKEGMLSITTYQHKDALCMEEHYDVLVYDAPVNDKRINNGARSLGRKRFLLKALF